METQIKAGSFPGSGGGQGLVPGPWRKGLGRPAQESPHVAGFCGRGSDFMC